MLLKRILKVPAKFLTSIFIFSVYAKSSRAAVQLESSLNVDRLACPGELVIFTCTTRGTPILEWFSEEYIGSGRERLQILSESARNTSSITPDAVAVRINVSSESGVTVIVSELRIIAATKYPTATVPCSNGDQRFIQNTTFRTFAVTLTSTLNSERVAQPEDIIIFTCITRGSPILEWFSEEYIGTGRDRLQILSESERNTSSITPDAIATRINVTTDNGFVVIVSELRIITSVLYPNATISCSNGSPKNVNVTFQIIETASDKPIDSEISPTRIIFTTVSEAEQSADNNVSDSNPAPSGVDADIISGATTGAAIIIVVTGIIIMIVIILVKKFRREEGSVEPGPESGQHVDEDITTITSTDKEQECSYETKEPSPTHVSKNQGIVPKINSEFKKMDQDNLTNVSDSHKKRRRVMSTASTLNGEFDHGHDQYVSLKDGE